MPDEAAQLEVLVTPRASAERVGPMADGVLRVHVTRPPADGEANDAVRRLLARTLGIAPSRVLLVSGDRSRRKHFAVTGMDRAELARRLSG
jgi:uncharacterized protein